MAAGSASHPLCAEAAQWQEDEWVQARSTSMNPQKSWTFSGIWYVAIPVLGTQLTFLDHTLMVDGDAGFGSLSQVDTTRLPLL